MWPKYLDGQNSRNRHLIFSPDNISDSSEVSLGGNTRLRLTCIIDKLLGSCLVVVPVIHVSYGILGKRI